MGAILPQKDENEPKRLFSGQSQPFDGFLTRWYRPTTAARLARRHTPRALLFKLRAIDPEAFAKMKGVSPRSARPSSRRPDSPTTRSGRWGYDEQSLRTLFASRRRTPEGTNP